MGGLDGWVGQMTNNCGSMGGTPPSGAGGSQWVGLGQLNN